MAQDPRPTIILGGGFTGLFTALHLSRKDHPHPIYLIDQNDRFAFKPLLYELMSGEMQDEQVCPTYEALLRGRPINAIAGTVRDIDLKRRRVSLESGLHYDYGRLVLALGSVTSYFGIEGAREHSFAFRTQEDAIALTQHLHHCLQSAAQCDDAQARRALLTMAVVGAGPSGIEMAATLGDLLPLWYAKLGGDAKEISIVLINRGSAILEGDINSQLRQTAELALRQRTVPVDLCLNAAVKAVSAEQLTYETDGKTVALPTHTAIWTAGTGVHPLIKGLDIPDEHRDKHGRLLVQPELQLPDYPEVFAGGDCAGVDGQSLPPTAQVAYQQGEGIAHNLHALATDQPLRPVEVNLRGSLLKLGIHDSAANLFNRFEVNGNVGHLIRQGTYLELLPTPIHDIKATAEWLTDEVFNRYYPPKAETETEAEEKQQWALAGIAGLAVACVVAGGAMVGWWAFKSQPFHRVPPPQQESSKTPGS
ncbi:NAD(P)/FAD-dependent oxidoreductase [Nodosilinea nodulosa]|uniref:NAD(P)/FAD-dependent oxidoreductase n=1 Tax=Nodosilinea nodulosa TaxID=416001 RepID=UPI0003041354|nr:NAD(P)/FAD-dependent oxidoreductase [Nodosilinea nodulosa]